MLLLFGVAGIALSVLSIALLYVAARKPNPSRWVTDFWVSCIYLPVVMTLGIMGVASLVKVAISLGRAPVPALYWLISAGIAAATVVIYRMMGVRRRLASYAAESSAAATAAAAVINLPRPDGEIPPAKPTTPRKRAA